MFVSMQMNVLSGETFAKKTLENTDLYHLKYSD